MTQQPTTEQVPGLTLYGIDPAGPPLDEAARRNADRVRDWLLVNIEPRRTINRNHSSYSLKHLAEQSLGYVTNGEFILGAVAAGYPFEPDPPNARFGMSERSINALREVTR